jgi:hypothetical protein
LALEIARGFKHIIGEGDKYGMTGLQLLASIPSAFKPVRRRGFLEIISSKGKNHKLFTLYFVLLLFSFSNFFWAAHKY